MLILTNQECCTSLREHWEITRGISGQISARIAEECRGIPGVTSECTLKQIPGKTLKLFFEEFVK